MARSLGNEFAPFFNQLAPHIVPYTTEKHPKSDRNMAIGCITEVFAACEAVIPTYFNDYLPLLEANSNTDDSKLNRNVAYSIGVLAQHSAMLFQPHVNNSLVLLKKLHDNTKEVDAQDNIVAASARIIEFQYLPLPVDQRPAEFIGMVDSVFQKVPFMGDMTENETIIKLAFKLYQVDQPLCLKHIEAIAKTCLRSIVDEKCRGDLTLKFKQEVGQFIKAVVMPNAQATLQQLETEMT